LLCEPPDLPDDFMRHRKARAAPEGRRLRDRVLAWVERGLKAAAMAAPA